MNRPNVAVTRKSLLYATQEGLRSMARMAMVTWGVILRLITQNASLCCSSDVDVYGNCCRSPSVRLATNVISLANDQPHSDVLDYHQSRTVSDEQSTARLRLPVDSILLQCCSCCAQSVHIYRSKQRTPHTGQWPPALSLSVSLFIDNKKRYVAVAKKADRTASCGI